MMYITIVLSITTHLFSGWVLIQQALAISSQNLNINLISSFIAALGSQQKWHKLTRFWFCFFFNFLQLYRTEQQNLKGQLQAQKDTSALTSSLNQQPSFPIAGWVKETLNIIFCRSWLYSPGKVDNSTEATSSPNYLQNARKNIIYAEHGFGKRAGPELPYKHIF